MQPAQPKAFSVPFKLFFKQVKQVPDRFQHCLVLCNVEVARQLSLVLHSSLHQGLGELRIRGRLSRLLQHGGPVEDVPAGQLEKVFGTVGISGSVLKILDSTADARFGFVHLN